MPEEVAMLNNEDLTLHRCSTTNMTTACGVALCHMTVTVRSVLELKADRLCASCYPDQ